MLKWDRTDEKRAHNPRKRWMNEFQRLVMAQGSPTCPDSNVRPFQPPFASYSSMPGQQDKCLQLCFLSTKAMARGVNNSSCVCRVWHLIALTMPEIHTLLLVLNTRPWPEVCFSPPLVTQLYLESNPRVFPHVILWKTYLLPKKN